MALCSLWCNIVIPSGGFTLLTMLSLCLDQVRFEEMVTSIARYLTEFTDGMGCPLIVIFNGKGSWESVIGRTFVFDGFSVKS